MHSGIGGPSEITCIVNAYPKPIITWHKNNKEITHNKGFTEMSHGIIKGNRTKYVLKFVNTTIHDFGEYKCRAQNAIGQSIRTIRLTGKAFCNIKT